MRTKNHAPRRLTSPQFLHLFLLLCFLISFVAWAGSLLHVPVLGAAHWAEDLFPVLALATTLMAMTRSLPLQNVLSAAALIAAISGIIEIINVKTGFPFGPLEYTGNLGPQLFGVLPLAIPMIWTVAILNSRGVARLILRPWRKTGKYGYWLVGLTCALTVILDVGLEPFATTVNHYWIWHVREGVPAWHTAPWVNFVSWTTTTLLMLVIATPWLINKRHIKHAPPDYHPLMIWLLLNLLLTAGNAGHQLWGAVGFSLVACVIAMIFAWRGARW